MDDYNALEWPNHFLPTAFALTSDNLDDQRYYHSTPDSSESTFELWRTGTAPPMNAFPIDSASIDTAPDSLPRTTETLNYLDLNQIDASATQNNGYAPHFENTKLCVSNSAYSHPWERPLLQQVNQPQLELRSEIDFCGTSASQKGGQRVSCTRNDCSMNFSSNSDMRRHVNMIHEEGGCICGLCQDEGSNNKARKLIRKDHFLNHLRKDHGFNGASTSSLSKCQICQPENENQNVWFPTQDTLELHLRRMHQEISQPSDAIISSQDPSSYVLAGSCDILINSKCGREQDQGQGMKRSRSTSTAVLRPFSNKRSCPSTENTASDSILRQRLTIPPESPKSKAILIKAKCHIPNVSPYDFIRVKSELGDFSNLFKKDNLIPGIPLISFDVSRRRITVCAGTQLIGEVKAGVEKRLESTRNSKDPVFKGIFKTFCSRMEDQRFADFCPPTATHEGASSSANIFAIRKKEDSEIVVLWMMRIAPALSKILDETVGRNYTASLVRQGPTAELSTPVVRIESPQVPLESRRKSIRKQLDEACKPGLRTLGIQVHFLKGSLVLVSGEGEIEVDDAPRPLPYYTRYWKRVGMGASIGMLCTDDEFATLGCYLDVDGQTFILSVDHFITKSYGKVDMNRPIDHKTLTSPALAKVKKMTEDLQALQLNLVSELEAKSVEVAESSNGLLQDSGDQLLPLRDLACQLTLIDTLLSELEKSDLEFKVGSLSYRSGKNTLAQFSNSNSTVASIPTVPLNELRHRVDWALFEVDQSSCRQGKNRHRYKHWLEGSNTEFLPIEQHIIDEGEGEICQETCAVEGNEEVCFVGQTSGALEGEVNGALRLVKLDDGVETYEHHIIMKPEYRRSARAYAGDSGAVVLRKDNKKMVGLIWGCNTDPTFTPIRTVFENIKHTIRAEHVDLPRTPGDVPPSRPSILASETSLISGSQQEALKARPYRISDVPLLIGPHTADANTKLLKYLSQRVRKAKENSNLRCVSPETIGTESRLQTPVPSLSDSGASSPRSLPTSPNPTCIDMMSIPSSPVGPILVVGEDVVEDIATTPSVDQAADGATEYKLLDKLLVDNSIIGSKTPIPYILRSMTRKPMEPLRSRQSKYGKPTRRWNTWPLDTDYPWNGLNKGLRPVEVIAQ